MNIQTEILDSHVARLTVQIDEDVFERAKKKATQAIAKKVNIPGFRKGHAPYHLIANYYGEATIIEEVVELLAKDLYPSVIESSGINPYASGTIENFEIEPTPYFIFSVPLQPEADLKDYRAIRVDYTEAVVTEEELKDAMLEVQREQSNATPSDEPAVMGDRVRGSLHGYWADVAEDNSDEIIPVADEHASENQTDEVISEADEIDPLEADDDDYEDEDDEENDIDHANAIIHEHDVTLYLSEAHEFVPGVSSHLIGAKAGKTLKFTLTYPEHAKYGAASGRAVRFVLDVAKVEHVTIPELNDDLAREITKSEASPLTLAELSNRVRENIQLQRQKELNSRYVESVIHEIVQQAVFRFPEEMIVEEVDEIISNVASRIGMPVEDFLKIMQGSGEDIHQDATYRAQAVERIQHLLVMRGVMEAENIVITPAQVDAEIEKVIATTNGNSEDERKYRKMFSDRKMRDNVYNRMLEDAILDRIIQIGRGLAEGQGVAVSKQFADDDTSSDSK